MTRRGWNHRVIRHRNEAYEDEQYFYVVHNVYYEIDGDSEEIFAWSEEGLAPQGETLEDLKAVLELYQAALAKPVLEEAPGAKDGDAPVLREVDCAEPGP